MSDVQSAPDSQAIPDEDVIANLQLKAQEHLAGWQRATADYQNLKKQSEKEKQEMASYMTAQTVLEFLPIYDNLKRAVKHIPADQQELDWVKGITHIVKFFEETLRAFGMTVIPTVGETFDHVKHHAISKLKKEGVATDTILEEVKTGFMMHDKVIEPAQVVVAE